MRKWKEEPVLKNATTWKGEFSLCYKNGIRARKSRTYYKIDEVEIIYQLPVTIVVIRLNLKRAQKFLQTSSASLLTRKINNTLIHFHQNNSINVNTTLSRTLNIFVIYFITHERRSDKEIPRNVWMHKCQYLENGQTINLPREGNEKGLDSKLGSLQPNQNKIHTKTYSKLNNIEPFLIFYPILNSVTY